MNTNDTSTKSATQDASATIEDEYSSAALDAALATSTAAPAMPNSNN